MDNSQKTDSAEITNLKQKLKELNITPTVDLEVLAECIRKINPKALLPIEKLSEDVKASMKAMAQGMQRFHGAKANIAWFPPVFFNNCSDRFGYLSSSFIRGLSKLDFTAQNINLLESLGTLMGDTGRDVGPDSNIPSGYTYFGQFVDHDITLDVTSDINIATDANTIPNMRTPSLDLDSLYSRGPALDPFLYTFPSVGPLTAIKFKLGTNTPVVPGGPGGFAGLGGMRIQTNFDVPRLSGNTAVIGDPRNDENLVVSQFHSAMLKFHNAVVDSLVVAAFNGDIFVEAKKIVTHHYQWAIIHDYLPRICGPMAVTNALSSVTAPIGSAFRMPVEFSVAAYRFGHSLIRQTYWLNFNFTNQQLSDLFKFIRNPNLPVLSNWVVDFNAFFPTGIPVPVFNSARKIDSNLASGLGSLPGGAGIMGILAARNLRRGLALGLPSGQGMANSFGIIPLTTAQLTAGIPANELAALNDQGGTLLQKTPLWYYILREAAILGGGDNLGPVGAKIVADTFVRILKRDSKSFLNEPGGFNISLPTTTPGNFTVTDIIKFARVHLP